MAHGPVIQKHHGFVMYRFRRKLVRLLKPDCLRPTIEKTLAYYKSCPFAVHYGSVKFYSTGPCVDLGSIVDEQQGASFR
jgi:hypothetical protein